MEELKGSKLEKDNEIAIHAKREERDEMKLIGSQRLIKGLRMFELNLETFEIKQTIPIKTSEPFVLEGNEDKGNRLTYIGQANCKYIQAINLKNAKKKFTKYLVENGQIDID